MNVLAQMTWPQFGLAWILIFICLFLMLVVLIQRGRGGGLTGAFGGAGGSSAFGAKTGDVFTWITVIVATVFVFLAVVANYIFDKSVRATPPPVVSAADEEPAEPTGTKTITTTTPSPISVTVQPQEGDAQQGNANAAPAQLGSGDGLESGTTPGGAPAQPDATNDTAGDTQDKDAPLPKGSGDRAGGDDSAPEEGGDAQPNEPAESAPESTDGSNAEDKPGS